MVTLGFPGGTVVKNLPVNAGDTRDVGSIPESGRSPGLEMDWKWQSTPVFLPGNSHGQRGLVGYSPWGCKELDRLKRRCKPSPPNIFLLKKFFLFKRKQQAQSYPDLWDK